MPTKRSARPTTLSCGPVQHVDSVLGSSPAPPRTPAALSTLCRVLVRPLGLRFHLIAHELHDRISLHAHLLHCHLKHGR